MLVGYHSTSKKQAGKILTNGFQPLKYAWRGFHNGRQVPKSHWKWTWFTTEPNLTYGEIYIAVDLTGLNYIASSEWTIICKEELIPKERILYVKSVIEE